MDKADRPVSTDIPEQNNVHTAEQLVVRPVGQTGLVQTHRAVMQPRVDRYKIQSGSRFRQS